MNSSNLKPHNRYFNLGLFSTKRKPDDVIIVQNSISHSYLLSRMKT